MQSIVTVKKVCNQRSTLVLVFQMRKECVMYRSGLDHLLLFCGTTGTPGKLPTTTSRGTATSGSKVSSFLCKKRLYLIQQMRNERHWLFLSHNNPFLFSQRRRRAAYRIWPTREEWHAEHKAGKFTCVLPSSGSW